MRMLSQIKVLPHVNGAEFRKTILNQGFFRQCVVSPYASYERNIHQKVLIFSDQIKEPTMFTHRSKPLAMILPCQEESQMKDLVETHYGLLIYHTGVAATYMGIFDLKEDYLLFQVQDPKGIHHERK